MMRRKTSVGDGRKQQTFLEKLNSTTLRLPRPADDYFTRRLTVSDQLCYYYHRNSIDSFSAKVGGDDDALWQRF